MSMRARRNGRRGYRRMRRGVVPTVGIGFADKVAVFIENAFAFLPILVLGIVVGRDRSEVAVRDRAVRARRSQRSFLYISARCRVVIFGIFQLLIGKRAEVYRTFCVIGVVKEVAFAELYYNINIVSGDGVGAEEYGYLRPIAQFAYVGNRRGRIDDGVGFAIEYADGKRRTFRKIRRLCPQRQSVEFIRSNVQSRSRRAGIIVRRGIRRYEIQRRSRVIGMRILNDVELYGFVIGGIARFSGFCEVERAYRVVRRSFGIRQVFDVEISGVTSVVDGFIIPILSFVGNILFGS